MAAKKDATGRSGAQHIHGTAQTFTITRGDGRKWRTMRTGLTEWQIASENKISGICKRSRQGDQ
jgi:hypothetical protein